MQELARLQEKATQKRNQWSDIRSGKIRFATEAEKLLHLEGTWMSWKQAVAELNAHKYNCTQISSSSSRQGGVIRIAIVERNPTRSVPSHM